MAPELHSNDKDTDASKSSRRPRFVRWAVMVGIIIAANLFFLAARSLVLPIPDQETFCPGIYTATTAIEQTNIQTCEANYENTVKQRNLYSFGIEVALGIIVIIIGVLPLGSSIVSTGLTYSGVVALAIAAMSYWGDAGSWIRTGISLAALIILLYIGLKRFKD